MATNLAATMHAMVLESAGQPLVYKTLPVPAPAADQLLVKVIACGVCRTDLHIVDGELDSPKLPLVPGHEIIGEVVQTGKEIMSFKAGDIVGIPWLGYTCGKCRYCLKGQENLCANARFTGYTLDGGFAEFAVADSRYCFLLPANYANAQYAPLLCAGLIGFRSYRMIGDDAQKIGIYGFGAAAHILIQIALFEGKKIFAFTRPDDRDAQQLALQLGAHWVGDSLHPCPEPLDAAIIFAPVGSLVPIALQDTDKGGIVICGGIHMSDIPSFPYKWLWNERKLQSVANLTRNDGKAFFEMVSRTAIHTQTKMYPLMEANTALNDLRNGAFQGAAVLVNGNI
ncbi:alcohol dehydrogenase [Niastella koreensis]|uniref:Zinc-binding alcohol dehydrogenase family protein n=2 Tax=Niastella koreensis TaxID=354356 RepID=G8TJA7_NIAKG|nr:zinc-dependent alcohol dehydrogenase family protein [Niastella koreensis]AEV98640.1 zinc-binding alcohol dehydrogenase family protein [Niastella koreensis GR20-10]OQP52918.1 alcohol dehydrogenase [Niastella koreensis]